MRTLDFARTVGVVCVVTVLLLALGSAPVSGQDTLPPSAWLYGIQPVILSGEWVDSGPVNVTMALTYYGWTHDETVAARRLKPTLNDPNVTPTEIVEYINFVQTDLPNTRAFWRYGGSLDLLKRAVAAGFPVLVETGYVTSGGVWIGQYLTIVGYDDTTQTIWVHDGYSPGDANRRVSYSYADFDAVWRQFNRVFVVLFGLDRENQVRSLLGSSLDPSAAAEQALTVARADAQADPSDAWAWFEAGTSAVKLGLYADAAIYFDEALRLGLPERVLWYQFGPYEAYYGAGRYDDVIALADATEAATLYVEETNYWRGMAYAAQGRSAEALLQFDTALRLNAHFTAAQEAKAGLGGQAAAPGVAPTRIPPTRLPPPTSAPTCGSLPMRMRVNAGGRTTLYPVLDTHVRRTPGFSAPTARTIPPGQTFWVIDGPQCADGVYWWWIEGYDQYGSWNGWIGEGQNGSYWIEPFDTGPIDCPGAPPPRLMPGQRARITQVPALPSRVRSAPNRGGTVIAMIDPGVSFMVVSGPVCDMDTRWRWWYVETWDTQGWVSEGPYGEYWMEPWY